MTPAGDTDGLHRLITFEGVDGAGKSTHVEWFAGRLAERCGAEVVVTREPGGTPLGEALRDLVLHRSMALETETLLMFAARRELVADVIEPALGRDAWVVCDRFTDATVAYQGGGRGLALAKIDALRRIVHPDLEPSTTLLFDLEPAIAQRRIDAAGDRYRDRFERETIEFFVRVRDTYLRLAADEPHRFIVIDGSKSVEQVRAKLEVIVINLCSKTKKR